jgi:predicted RNA binding protein YcfA (HicA-like mRNA interferase family)
MSRLPILSGKKVIKALEQIGFEVVRQKGSHVRLKHEDGRVVTVPVHAGQDISRGLLRKILRDAELTPQKLKDLLSI